MRGFLASLSQPPVSPLPPGINLKGKTAIIPGSNGGIGYEAARQLQGLNISNIILAVRSMSKGEAAKNTLAADNTEIAKSDAPRHGWLPSKSDVSALNLLMLNAGIACLKHGYAMGLEATSEQHR